MSVGTYWSYFPRRAIVTGMVLGALLAPCNIYSGLKIGWSFNMSITAVLLSFAFWKVMEKVGASPLWTREENLLSQTTASSAGSILSVGLVAPIPALAIISGENLHYWVLTIWVFLISLNGILVALSVRQQMLNREKLPFPNGIATAKTLEEIYQQGSEAFSRVRWLVGSMIFSGGIKLFSTWVLTIPSLILPIVNHINVAGKTLAVSGINLGWKIEPSLMMIGFGGIVGLRVGLSLLLGAVIAWWILPGHLIESGWVLGDFSEGMFWFSEILEWLLWPGVALMVSASISSVILQLCKKQVTSKEAIDSRSKDRAKSLSAKTFWGSFAMVGISIILAQYFIFSIEWYYGLLAFGLTFFLSVVASRVSGETGIPTIGALGKMTQLVFGFLIPGSVTHNLMSANVTGGAAGQSSDLLHDLKAGKLLGMPVVNQIIAQVFGVLVGSFSGVLAYLILIPNPQAMLLTEEWPAPAVLTWKAVAELFQTQGHAFLDGSMSAVYLCVVIGVLLSVLEVFSSNRMKKYIPSASSVGLAFVIPASISLMMFLGAFSRSVLNKFFPSWSARNALILFSGLVAGESIAGVVSSIVGLVF